MGRKVIWTKEKCEEEAKKYLTMSEFRKNSRSAYEISLRNNWIWEYGLKRYETVMLSYWNCWEEAMKYTTKSDFYTKSESAYHRALESKWLNDYTWLL